MLRRTLTLAGAIILLGGLAVQAVFAAHPSAAGSGIGFGPPHNRTVTVFKGFYDGHKDVYVNTDVSSKAQAKKFAINFAPKLKSSPMSATSPMYFVVGRAAPGQLAVFGSEPGGTDYSPLWQEFIVKWKKGVKPVLLTSDNATLAKQAKGKLTVTATKVILNSPILQVGKH